MTAHNLPFHLFVGQDGAKTSLKLQLITQDIRNTLLIGRTGTGKSTLARSVATLSKNGMLCLPQNGTSDTIFGSIDIERSIQEGTILAKPGLLSEVSGKILLIDDVHLMDPRILAEIFAAVETSQVIIERDGLSFVYPVQFQIIATLNPDEGKFSHHLIDRFDLCGYCLEMEEIQDRINMMQVVLASERKRNYSSINIQGDIGLREQLMQAQERYQYTSIPDGLMDLITRLSDEVHVQGHRGEVALARAARAHAALHGRDLVTLDDISVTAQLALQHRRNPNEPPVPPNSSLPDHNESKQNSDKEDQSKSGSDKTSDTTPNPREKGEDATEPDTQSSSFPEPDQIFPIGEILEDLLILPPPNIGVRAAEPMGGRKGIPKSGCKRGRYIRSSLPRGKAYDISLEATIRAAAPYQKIRTQGSLALTIHTSDIRVKVRKRNTGRTILFVVDSSGSMGAARRMTAVKGAIFSLLQDAYVKRELVSLICFRGKTAEVILPPTRSGTLAYRKLQELPTGGQTPLADGVQCMVTLLNQINARGSAIRPLVLFISDGRANVSLHSLNPLQDALDIALLARNQFVDYLVIDTEVGYPRLGLAKRFADTIGGAYVRLSALEAESLVALTKITV